MSAIRTYHLPRFMQMAASHEDSAKPETVTNLYGLIAFFGKLYGPHIISLVILVIAWWVVAKPQLDDNNEEMKVMRETAVALQETSINLRNAVIRLENCAERLTR